MRCGRLSCGLILCAALSGVLAAQSHRSASSAASFDYYVLALSWAPAFCEQPDAASGNPDECMPGKRTGFVVHGLWPQASAGKSPEFCGAAGRVPKEVVKFVARYMPSPGLIQHEWEAHGVCTGLKPPEYFGAVVETRGTLQVPVQFTSIDAEMRESPGQIETQFAAANPGFPREAFRTACAREQLKEERICFDKNRKPQACTASVGECGSLSVAIPPPL